MCSAAVGFNPGVKPRGSRLDRLYITIGAMLSFLLMMGGELTIFGLAIGIPGGLNFWFALVLVLLFTGLLGWGISRITFTPIHSSGPIPLLLTSIGLGFVLRGIFRIVFGLERKFVDPAQALVFLPDTTFRFDVLGGFFVTTTMLLVIALTLVAFGVLHLLLTRTDLGIAMRATSSNEDLALLSGIPAFNIRQATWVLASALAGLSGALLSISSVAISPIIGFDQILLILSAAILGGAGSVYGALFGAYIIGLSIALIRGSPSLVGGVPVLGDVEPLIALLGVLSELPIAVAFFVLIVVLLVAPSGIAGTEVEA
ncbi:MAG: branched-chain amino acid ABC transporter permease [Salinirussus sp.]